MIVYIAGPMTGIKDFNYQYGVTTDVYAQLARRS